MTPIHKLQPRRIDIAPGSVVINISGARGGVSYTREVVNVETKRAAKNIEFANVMRVDHAGYVKQIDALVKKVDDTVLRNLCVKTRFGHFVAEAGVDEVRAHVAEIRVKVAALNAAAAAAGSRHQGHAGVVIARLDVQQPEVVAECARAVYTAVGDLYSVLRAGDVDDAIVAGKVTHRGQLRPALLRAKNVELLVVGDAGRVLRTALARVSTARTEIRKAVAEGATPAEAGRKIDLSAVEAALTWFEV